MNSLSVEVVVEVVFEMTEFILEIACVVTGVIALAFALEKWL